VMWLTEILLLCCRSVVMISAAVRWLHETVNESAAVLLDRTSTCRVRSQTSWQRILEWFYCAASVQTGLGQLHTSGVYRVTYYYVYRMKTGTILCAYYAGDKFREQHCAAFVLMLLWSLAVYYNTAYTSW